MLFVRHTAPCTAYIVVRGGMRLDSAKARIQALLSIINNRYTRTLFARLVRAYRETGAVPQVRLIRLAAMPACRCGQTFGMHSWVLRPITDEKARQSLEMIPVLRCRGCEKQNRRCSVPVQYTHRLMLGHMVPRSAFASTVFERLLEKDPALNVYFETHYIVFLQHRFLRWAQACLFLYPDADNPRQDGEDAMPLQAAVKAVKALKQRQTGNPQGWYAWCMQESRKAAICSDSGAGQSLVY